MKTQIRHRLAVVVLLLALGACAKAPPGTDPDVPKLMAARNATVAINGVQSMAIALHDNELLSKQNADEVVDAAVDARAVIRQLPEGWKAAVNTLIDRVESRLDAAGKSSFSPYLETLRALLKGVS